MTRLAVSTSRGSALVDDDYLDLVKEFPLRVLRNQKEYSLAGAVMDRFIGRDDLGRGQRDYLDALARFMEEYESRQRRESIQRLTPLELLRHLMEENDMNTADLGYVLGSRGLASEVLNGRRGLSKRLIAKLAARFNVSAALFLEEQASA